MGSDLLHEIKKPSYDLSMKNQTMNIKTIFYPLSLLVAAVTMTACSSDDDAATANADSQTGTFQVSIDVGPAMTRAISVGGNDGYTLYTNWDTGDEVQVVKDGATSVAGTLTADVSEGNSAYATLNGTLTGTFAVSDQVKLYYHSANIDYTGQKGTMADVSTNKSFLTATSTVQEIGQATGTVKDGSDKYLVMSNAAYQAMQSYLEISFTDAEGNALAIPQLDIWTSGGKLVKTAPLGGDKTYATEVSPLTVTPDAATDHFFLALRDEAGASNTIYFKATTADNTYSYNQDLNLEIGEYYYAASPKAMIASLVHLDQLTSNCTVVDGQTMTGTLANNVKISIADGATVTLDNVSINANGAWKSGDYAGINCLGDVTIILKDGTTNEVKGFSGDYPGIHVVSGKTLTIQGSTGRLTASPGIDDNDFCYAAGIGAGNTIACGNINIQGGIITATSDAAAGIGAGREASATCGNITISGGTITATGDRGAGIGAGASGATCGNIVIEGGTITATSSLYGAGIGGEASCGSISISGGTIEATGGPCGAGIGSGNFGSCTSITISGGTITATGQGGGAGIGGGYSTSSNCGNISITGGTIIATGSYDDDNWEGYPSAAGIGGGAKSNCGTIEITNSVTKVTATKGNYAPNSIGKGKSGTCGTVTIGGMVYWDGSAYQHGGDSYLTASPLVYQP
jgi:hypothetical protein